MKTKIFMLMLTASCFLLASCQNEDVETMENVVFTSNNQIIMEYNNVLKFTYDGVVYSSPCYETEDSLLIKDEKVAEIYNYLMNLPELATYCDSDGSIVYFDTFEELRATYDENVEPQIAPMFIWNERLYLYKDAAYQGKFLVFELKVESSIPGLGTWGFNDEATSFKVEAFGENSITLFEDKDYKGRTLTFTFRDNLSVTSLKNYRLKSGKTWNDKVTSIQVYPGKSKFGDAVSES